MNIKNITAGAVVALSLMSAPVMAQAVQAQSPNTAVAATVERGSAQSTNKSKLTGANAIIPLVLAAAIIAGGVYLIADDNNDGSPTSP